MPKYDPYLDHTQPPTVGGGVIAWLVAMIGLILVFLFLWAFSPLAYATEAPGCGNQHYRPRLSQCCPKFLVGEVLPPKCHYPLVSGFLRECCRTEPTPQPTPPQPTSTPVDACLIWPGWCSPVPTCELPTPLPTPESHQKGECCREVQRIYRDARLDIVDRKTVALKALVKWKQGAMRQCREGY